MKAGTPFGCADLVPSGAVPNEHGTWYYGRNGWCDGQDVKPVVFDITNYIVDGDNEVKYWGLGYDVGGEGGGSEDGCGGYILMSSSIAIYE